VEVLKENASGPFLQYGKYWLSIWALAIVQHLPLPNTTNTVFAGEMSTGI
jgi:hypothetical protein